MNKNEKFISSTSTQLIYYSILVSLLFFSFFYYAPCNNPFFNSDQAIHVLMAKQFELPRDYYFWGQDRLGSLLPLVSSIFCKAFPFEPIIIVSIIHYFFLFISFQILASLIRQWWLKIALAAFIFLPVNEYNHLILIGHPYASQLLCGSLFIYFSFYFYKTFEGSYVVAKFYFKACLFSFLSILFYCFGIWVSPVNASLIIIPILFIFFHSYEIIEKLKYAIYKPFFYFLIILNVTQVLCLVYFHFSFKRFSLPVSNTQYNQLIVDSKEKAVETIERFFQQVNSSLLFKNDVFIDDVFNWFTAISLIVLPFIIFRLKKSTALKRIKVLLFSLIILSGVDFLLIFFSNWNYIGGFCPRYFTPIYVLLAFSLICILSYAEIRTFIQISYTIFLLTISIIYCNNSLISKKLKTPIQEMCDFEKLPKGTLIGDFWDVYKINSIATQLNCIPFNHQTVRNFDWKDEALSNSIFYLIKNTYENFESKNDSFFQFGYFFVPTGKVFNCNGTEVWQYKKSNAQPLDKFILRASNNFFIKSDSNSKSLLANEPDSSKALVFSTEITRMGTAFKGSTGFYFSDNINDNKICRANGIASYDWELFRIICCPNNKVALLSIENKFVYADKSSDYALIANRNKIDVWEQFELIPIK